MGGQPTNLMGSHHWNNKYKIHPLEKLEMMVALLFTSLIPLSAACNLMGFQSKTPSQIQFFFLQNTADFQFFSKTPPIFKFVLSKTLLTCSVGVLIANTPQVFENFASPNFNFVSKTPTSKAGFETKFCCVGHTA